MLNQLKTYLKFGFTTRQLSNRVHYFFCKKGETLKYRPLWLLIYVSDLCNLKCKMCPHHTLGDASNFEFLKKSKVMMKPDTFQVVLDKFPEATLVMFAGVGEPLLNPHFFKLAEMASKNKKIINLVTNGVLLDREKINRIIEIKRFNQISVSLNASNPQDYSDICNMPSETFGKVVNNIKELVETKKRYKNKAKFEIIVSAVCSQEFIPKIKDYLLFADNLGADRIDVHNYIDFSIIEEKYQWASVERSDRNIEILKGIKQFSQEKIKTKANLFLVFKKENFCKKCEWFFKNLCFDALGNIGGCGRVINPDVDYGNLITDKEDVWNNQYMRKMRKKFLNNQEQLLNCCKNCIENY